MGSFRIMLLVPTPEVYKQAMEIGVLKDFAPMICISQLPNGGRFIGHDKELSTEA